ncbi:hypothetical protein, partial [Streptomyces rapamycinicus]|uniref:hypothetical protein n=1 Tax=Streptomyces rapamycinicus TaxID=1226757 RepID=UPI002073EC35
MSDPFALALAGGDGDGSPTTVVVAVADVDLELDAALARQGQRFLERQFLQRPATSKVPGVDRQVHERRAGQQ